MTAAQPALTHILKNMDFLISGKRLRARYSFITSENIETLFKELEVPPEFDFLSIDIDRNDFWIWRAIEHYHPRVVAIEYNASFKATVACTVPYDPNAIWDGYSNYFRVQPEGARATRRGEGLLPGRLQLYGRNFLLRSRRLRRRSFPAAFYFKESLRAAPLLHAHAEWTFSEVWSRRAVVGE